MGSKLVKKVFKSNESTVRFVYDDEEDGCTPITDCFIIKKRIISERL